MGILDQFSLINKVALVTGASRGLGQAMALGLAEAGADLVLVDIDDCQVTQNIIRQLDRKCMYLKTDLISIDAFSAESILQEALNEMGQLDILLNNAGIVRRSPAELFSEKDWKEVLSINLDAVFYLSQAAGKYYIDRGEGGKMINMASMLSFQGGVSVVSYTAAKSAVAGLTKALANEWAPHHIQVNAIAPGYFKTEVTRDIYEDSERGNKILERIPAGRWGLPNDLQGILVFLASEASSYVNGSIIPIDGGWLGR